MKQIVAWMLGISFMGWSLYFSMIAIHIEFGWTGIILIGLGIVLSFFLLKWAAQ